MLQALWMVVAVAWSEPIDPVIYPPEVLPEDEVRGGELRVEAGGALVLEHTSVVAEVHAGLARVTMIQWFHNPYDEALEATYLFPLPSDAAVDRMDLVCGDRLIAGVVMERQAARDAYEQAHAEGKRAALLEQERDNLFTQHVSGLCPGETVEVTVQYVQQLAYEDGVYALTFPMTVGPRFTPPWVEDADALETPYERTGRDVDLTVIIDEGTPIESLWSDSHDVVVENEDARGATIALEAADTVPNRDFELRWILAGRQPRATLLAHRPDPQEPGYLALSVEPQIVDDLFEPRPRELLFVLDASCSMSGEPWDLASRTVLHALDEMQPGDAFNLVTFSNDANALFERPQPATPDTLGAARHWLETAFDGGGTHMERGVVRSLTMPGDPERLRLVLMLTDGYIGHEQQIFDTVKEHLGAARLFSLGIGGAPNRYLLEGLAEMGRGDVSYQGYDAPIAETVDAFYERIAHPAMSDVRVDWGGLEVIEQYPSRIPDLWSGQPIRVVARYQGGGPVTVRVSGMVGTERYEQTLQIDIPEQTGEHEAIASLWARRKIRDLEWYPRGRSEQQVRQEVLDVALEHHLVSRYTSLVAIDDVEAACGPVTMRIQVPNEAPAGLAGAALYGYGTGALGTKGKGYGSGYGSGYGILAGKQSRPIQHVRSNAIVLGSIDRTTIDDVVRRDVNAIRYCYEKALRLDSTLAGKVVVKFVIAPDGSVSTATIRSSELDDEAVEQCVAGRFLKMQFPQPAGGGIVIVSYPFQFEPGPARDGR